MVTQTNLFTGESLANSGMELAKESADRKEPGWSERVWEKFKEWLASKPVGFEFMMEDFRDHEKGDIKGQAFGFISKRARKEKLIEFSGLSRTKNPISHNRPANVWRKK